MKAEIIKDRPNYELLKQSDVVNFYHLQFPRWLIEDSRYMPLSLEAKFTYTLLFNRFQLSKHNNWINDNGEVFVIYTRKELSEKLNASEKRISAAMNELKAYLLIWECRCGRGFANQIYLANVKISVNDAVKSKGGPPDPQMDNEDLRTDETAGLNDDAKENEKVLFSDDVNTDVDNSPQNEVSAPITSAAACQELLNPDFKKRQNSGSKTDISAVQEPLKLPPSNKDFKDLELNYYNHSQSESSPYFASACVQQNGRTDADIIEKLIEQSELESFSEDDASVIKDAIERLYYMQSIKISNAVYPSERIRSNLWRLDYSIVQDAIYKITKNINTIRNSSAYVVTVLFNTIMESGSDLFVDPYLDFLRNRPGAEAVRMGGG